MPARPNARLVGVENGRLVSDRGKQRATAGCGGRQREAAGGSGRRCAAVGCDSWSWAVVYSGWRREVGRW